MEKEEILQEVNDRLNNVEDITKSLIDWQEKQNGSITRIESKIDLQTNKMSSLISEVYRMCNQVNEQTKETALDIEYNKGKEKKRKEIKSDVVKYSGWAISIILAGIAVFQFLATV